MIPALQSLAPIIDLILQALTGAQNGGMGVQPAPPAPPPVSGPPPTALQQWMSEAKQPLENRPAVAHYRQHMKTAARRPEEVET